MFAGDDRFFPLVLHRTRGAMSSGDVEAMRAFYLQIHGRKAPFIHLVDARGADRPDAAVRKQLGEMASSLVGNSKLYQVGNAIVLDSRLTAGAMTALRWVVPAPVTEKFFGSVVEAAAWLEQLGAPKGIALSSDAKAYLQRLERDVNAAA